MKAAFYTLGCKVNQNETAAMEEIFRTAGYEIVPHTAAADVFVVNSCTVTAEGDAKSRRALSRARRQNPGVVTVLCGCGPQAFPQQAAATGANVVCGTAQRAGVLAAVQAHLAARTQVVQVVPHTPAAAFEELPTAAAANRTRAFVKVQDGCNRRCAYCIIPTARGPSRSRQRGAILQEVATLAAAGHAEVVFTGINLSSYGRDTGDDLPALVAAAAQLSGLSRIRLSSLEPDLLLDDAIAALLRVPAFCPHFHLSLQSGSDAVLRRMRRPYTTAQFAGVASAIRAVCPTAGITTDIIVGFPGESEAEFAETLSFVHQMRFLKVHVFPFSARQGTAAAGFPGQLPRAEKAARAATLQQAADAIRAEWITAQQGAQAAVLLEGPGTKGIFTGYTQNYIPVQLTAPGAHAGGVLQGTLGPYDGTRCAFFPADA